MPDNRLTEQAYWDGINLSYLLQFVPAEDKQAQWLERVLTQYAPGAGRSFEIGCYPGRFQGILGRHGFELNGIDLTPEVSGRLPSWIREHGFKVGKFSIADFESMSVDERYELVCSFGFIEHFVDWKSVFHKHIELLLPNGLLIITAPNFRGIIQRFLHAWLDQENLRRHNLQSMRPDLWKHAAVESGIDVLFAGYFGGFDFWVDQAERTCFQNNVLTKIARNLPLLRRFPFSSRLFSPYIGIVARN